jgi:glycosyltransferase involved in cell wall biosynthesis
MAVFNGEKYLSEAIESILTQTYSNFEFLIINDGSTDKTEDIILSYSDNRIRYIRNANNLKLIASLNIGLSCAKGVYIARMDADDVALPSRLERQVAKLEENPNIGLLGSFVETLGLFSNYEIKFLTDHDNIRLKLFFNNYLNHPSVMIRRDVLVQNHIQYESFLHAEDYLLWLRLASCCQIEILPEILLKYRIHGENISQVNKDFQQAQTY